MDTEPAALSQGLWRRSPLGSQPFGQVCHAAILPCRPAVSHPAPLRSAVLSPTAAGAPRPIRIPNCRPIPLCRNSYLPASAPSLAQPHQYTLLSCPWWRTANPFTSRVLFFSVVCQADGALLAPELIQSALYVVQPWQRLQPVSGNVQSTTCRPWCDAPDSNDPL